MGLSESNQQMLDTVNKSKKLKKSEKVRIKHTIQDGDKAVKEFGKALNGDTPHSSTSKAAARGEAKDVGGVAGQRLKAFIERVERLEEEKAGLAEDIKDVFAEAKGVGFDTTTIRRIIRKRKMEPQKRREADELFDLYMAAIGEE